MDPTFLLTVAVLNKLRASGAVTGFVGTDIYDNIPIGKEDVYPTISLGPSDVRTDDTDCDEIYELSFQIDVWSHGSGEAYSTAQVRKIAYAVREALRGYLPNIEGYEVTDLDHVTTRYFREEDTSINHAAMTYEASMEAAA